MAMIDYGSVVKKNGCIIQKEFFMDMKKAVGFVIDSVEYLKDEYVYDNQKEKYILTGKKILSKIDINDNYFSYIGDREFLVCIYKGRLDIFSNNKYIDTINDIPYGKFRNDVRINGVTLHIKRLFNNNRYKLHFEYKNNIYDVLYGYGVDVNKNLWYDVTPKIKRFVNNWYLN